MLFFLQVCMCTTLSSTNMCCSVFTLLDKKDVLQAGVEKQGD